MEGERAWLLQSRTITLLSARGVVMVDEGEACGLGGIDLDDCRVRE